MNTPSFHGANVMTAPNFSGSYVKCAERELLDIILAISIFFHICIVPVILASNFIVIFVSTKVSQAMLNTNTSKFITALAVADFMVGFCSIPVHVLNGVDETMWIAGSSKVMCYTYCLTAKIPGDASLTFLFLMSLDRFLAINWPFWYARVITNVKMYMAVALVFVLVVTLGVAKCLQEDTYRRNDPESYGQCLCNDHFSGREEIDHVTMTLYATLFTVALVLCLQVVHVINRKRRDTLARQTSAISIVPISRSRSTSLTVNQIKVTVYLMFIFFILWIPTFIVHFVKGYISDYCGLKAFVHWAQFFRVLNSAINAFVYAYIKASYKVAYKYLLTNPPCYWDNVEEVVRSYHFKTSTTQLCSKPSAETNARPHFMIYSAPQESSAGTKTSHTTHSSSVIEL